RLRPPQGSLRHADRARRGAGEPPLIPADPCPGRTRAAYEVPGNPVKMAEMARPKPPGEPEEGPECPGVEANATPVFPVFVRKKAQFAPKRGIITMRRTVLMGLAVLSAAAMPLAASAGPGALSASGPATAAQASSFTLGGAQCSPIKVLDPGVEASPEMCQFGGPTGINDDVGDGNKVLEYWGNGIGIGSTVPARSAVAKGFPNADHVYALGLALPGDSGSAVISDDGRAVGVLVTVGVHGFGVDQNGVDFGTVGITRIAPQLARASEVLGTRLSLVKAK